jgi:hypothetical protein
VDINQVGVPVDINPITTALLMASANHLETDTVLLASIDASTAPICMGHGMAARSG